MPATVSGLRLGCPLCAAASGLLFHAALRSLCRLCVHEAPHPEWGAAQHAESPTTSARGLHNAWRRQSRLPLATARRLAARPAAQPQPHALQGGSQVSTACPQTRQACPHLAPRSPSYPVLGTPPRPLRLESQTSILRTTELSSLFLSTYPLHFHPTTPVQPSFPHLPTSLQTS